MVAGLHVPVMPLVEVPGKAGGTEPEHIGPMGLNVGVILEVTLIVAVAVCGQPHEFVTVSEESIKEAVRFAFTYLKLVVEPSGALGLAALLSGAFQATGRVGVILSGGNIDSATMTMILKEGS